MRKDFAMSLSKFAVGALLALGLSAPAFAAGDEAKPPAEHWSFNGPFGQFDRGELQRGLKVYKEVCAACHSLRFVAFRTIDDFMPAGSAKALAATYEVTDGPNDQGEMFKRPGLPSDKFPSPFPNAKAAAAANGGAAPPDLSLMAKAREHGPDYIKALLLGYGNPPAGFHVGEGLNYNKYFPGQQIAMPSPLGSEGQVTYDDGTKATVEQMAHDVSAFLMWTAEPKLEDRKKMGLKVMIFLIVLTGLFFAAKKRIWSKLH